MTTPPISRSGSDPQAPDDRANAEFVAELTTCQLPLLLYVRSLVPGDPAAKDIVQQTNATIWEKRRQFELGTNFKAWAFAIARFEVLTYRKRQARDSRLKFSEDLEQTIARELADRPDDLERRHDALQHCLQKLRPQDRELLLHRYGSEDKLITFAETVGRSVGSLKVSLHRLRSTLLTCIERTIASGAHS